jgi:hypothetical protein
MDDQLLKKKKSSKSHPSQEEEAMTASLEKARLKEVCPVSAPLSSFEQPVVDSGTAAPTPPVFPDTVATQVDYDYGNCYGGVQPTLFNSSAVEDRENDAWADYLYHQGHNIRSATTSAPGYPAYSAPFSEADAYGHGHRASTATTSRELPLPALDKMERILQGIERAPTASSLAIQQFVGQGEFYCFR